MNCRVVDCVCVCVFWPRWSRGWSKNKPKGWFEKGCVVGCGFHVVVTVCPNGGKNPNKSDENPSKFAPRSGQGRSRYDGGETKNSFLSEK